MSTTKPKAQLNPASSGALSPREFQEKRDFIRMQIDSPVAVIIPGEETQHQGMCRDLSGGGMLIEVDLDLPVGSEIEVILASSHGHAPMLQATAVVTRAKDDSTTDSSGSIVGLRLKDILV